MTGPTRLSDIIAVDQFSAVVEGKITEFNKLRASGIIGTDPRVDRKAQQAGFDVNLRDWKRMAGGEATSQSDDPTQKGSPDKVQMENMIARVIARARGINNMAITDFASDAEALAFAAVELARLRASDEESAAYSILKGLVADNVSSHSADAVKDASITTGTIAAANKMSLQLLLQARGKLGDAADQLKFAVLHSDVANALRILDINAYIPASKTDTGLAMVGSWNIIETDQVGVDTTVSSYPVYTSYLVGAGLFAYASVPEKLPFENFRDPFAGNFSGEDTLINRYKHILHPYGYSNVAAPSNGVSQSNAELAADATWTRVAPLKAIPLVAIKTNG
jgi:hypothetical protein